MFRIEKALVTGGSSGIGKALVDLLLSRGCQVFSLSRTLHPDEVFSSAGRLHQISCDITDQASLERAFSEISTHTDSLDAVFSNAGYGIAGAIADTPKEQVLRQFDVNVFSGIEVIRKSLPYLEKTRGRILLTSSVAAIVSLPFQSFYSCSKACLNMLSLALNSELKPFGIRTVALMPGDVSTAFTDKRVKDACPVTAYGERCGQSVARMERDEKKGARPALIARKILRIAGKKSPKPYYGLGFYYRFVLLVFKLLPVRLSNWIVGRIYG